MAFYNVNQLYECSTGLDGAPSMAFYIDIEEILYSPHPAIRHWAK
jgi:hypothetical protein